MGKEVTSEDFSEADIAKFAKLVDAETDTLLEWGREGRFATGPMHVGEEIEACIIDDNYLPMPINARFLSELNEPFATQELASFNIEFNPEPVEFAPGYVGRFRNVFVELMQRSFNVAEKLDVRLLMAGILPTVSPGDLALPMMSSHDRYHTFVQRFAAWKQGATDFCTVEIDHNDGLKLGLGSIIMEAVTTSHQVHLQVTEKESGIYYNTALVLAGPLLALCANSPYFLGRNLWTETRVPLFEQILAPRFSAKGPRSSGENDFFGTAYVDKSILELFVQNRDNFAVMLPFIQAHDRKSLPHLTLHNGTIWRWNRPVLGFNPDGEPTLRIEHRFFPSGPTNVDMCANLALLTGATQGLAKGKLAGTAGKDVQKILPFKAARDNFYACARDGLDAKVRWFDNKEMPVRKLLEKEILPLAYETFKNMGMTEEDRSYLDVMAKRLESGNTGAQWQREFMQKNGGGSSNLRKLTAAYWRRQVQGLPVYMWTL